MAAGDVEGFASVAFPIVRRVFGGLLANDLVSVQPMSLPSGLIFFLDFTYQGSRLGLDADVESVYGGGVVARQITGGVTDITEEGGGFYNLGNAYSHATGTFEAALVAVSALTTTTIGALTEAQKKELRFDPDVLAADSDKGVIQLRVAAANVPAQLNTDMLGAIEVIGSSDKSAETSDADSLHGDDAIVRRLTKLDSDGNLVFTILDGATSAVTTAAADGITCSFPFQDKFQNSDSLGAVVGTANWPLEEPEPGTGNFADNEGKNTIAEIDIRVDSIAVTAQTKKLKAKWSPELGQDLNAYHNLDAEVELTQILSEQIALEIDREILNDLVQGATAGTYYWSRSPGLFVDRLTGLELGATAASPDFTGTVSEWYETLVETINDVSAQIHRKTLRGGANFLVTSPEVANILEFTAGFRANVTHDAERGTVGAVNVGSISRKFDVHVDPYFPRNVVLVGRKGGSFLESGYVYAPYVPLQVTPTIFGTEDFVPRKGVMTRYAKKMVRPDMYGLVICRGLLGESGAS
tara:strand:- start:308 stop:1879 length:1572 start_codon:yes stop_codon:yes gene_type:complete